MRKHYYVYNIKYIYKCLLIAKITPKQIKERDVISSKTQHRNDKIRFQESKKENKIENSSL